MAWNKMTSYKKTKDWKNVNQAMGEEEKAGPEEIEESTRKKCDAMLLAAQKEAGGVRQQALRAAQAAKEEAKKEAEALTAAAKEQAAAVTAEAEARAESLTAEAEEQAETIQAEARNRQKAMLEQAEKDSREVLDRARKEAEAIRIRAVQAARVICQSTLKEAREIYLDLQSEMNHMIDGINQAQNSFMKSYKEVHQILDTIPGKLIQLDEEEDELEDTPEVPADQNLLRHMEEILGGESDSVSSGTSPSENMP